MRPRLPSGIRHPEEMSLLRAPEKEKKKKKEKEQEEEVYDLTKVVLVGGECRLGQPRDAAGGGPGRGLGGWGLPGLTEPHLHSRRGPCVIPGDASPLLRQRPDGGLLPHAEPAAAPTGPPPAAAPAPAQLPLGQNPAPQQVRGPLGLHVPWRPMPRVLLPEPPPPPCGLLALSPALIFCVYACR